MQILMNFFYMPCFFNIMFYIKEIRTFIFKFVRNILYLNPTPKQITLNIFLPNVKFKDENGIFNWIKCKKVYSYIRININKLIHYIICSSKNIFSLAISYFQSYIFHFITSIHISNIIDDLSISKYVNYHVLTKCILNFTYCITENHLRLDCILNQNNFLSLLNHILINFQAYSILNKKII